MGVGNRLVLRTPPASNGPKCTCTVVAVYPVTSAYHARDSTCHAHSLAFVKFEVPFLPIDPKTVCAAFIWMPWDARSCRYVFILREKIIEYRTGRFIGEDFILAIGDLFNFSPIFKTPTKYIRYDN